MSTLRSSDSGTMKMDLSNSQAEKEHVETKIDLAAESDKNELLTVQEEESGDGHMTATQSNGSHMTATQSGDGHVEATPVSSGVDSGESAKESGDNSEIVKNTDSNTLSQIEGGEVIANQNALEDSVSGGNENEGPRTSDADTVTSL